LHRNKNEHTEEIHNKDGDSGVDFTLGSSKEAQEAEQKTRRKRKQIRSTANPRSTPALRKKNRTARSSSKVNAGALASRSRFTAGERRGSPPVAD
jgi:hypothetical protein